MHNMHTECCTAICTTRSNTRSISLRVCCAVQILIFVRSSSRHRALMGTTKGQVSGLVDLDTAPAPPQVQGAGVSLHAGGGRPSGAEQHPSSNVAMLQHRGNISRHSRTKAVT